MSDQPAPLDRAWLSLGPASRLVGVDPGTLRRWADAGRVVAFTTPGGHRRFDRRALERLATSRRPASDHPFSLLGATSDGFSRAYRRSYRAATSTATDVSAVAGSDRAVFRQDGRRLVEALLAYLDTPAGDGSTTREDAEGAAVELTDDLAARLGNAEVSLTDAVELFVAARRPFLAELGLLAGRRGLDPASLAAAYEDAAGLLDRLLLRFIGSHQARPAATSGS